MSESSKRTLFQIYNRRGLGHLMRGANIARAMIRMDPAVKLLFHARSDPPPGILPSGVHVVTPGNRQWDDHWAETLRSFAPHVVVYDTMLPKSDPKSSARLDDDRRAGGRSSRGIVYIMRKCQPERQTRIFQDPFLETTDRIIVPHTRREFGYTLPESLEVKSNFVGAIVRPVCKNVQRQLAVKYRITPEEFVLVSTAGGGGFQEDADFFWETVFQVHRLLSSRLAALRHIVVTGPNYGRSIAPLDGMTLVEFEPELVNLFALSKLVIAAGGYNTVNEVRVSKSPAVFLPGARSHDDQNERVASLQDSGLAFVFNGLAASDVARKIAEIGCSASALRDVRQRYTQDQLQIGNEDAARWILALLDRHASEDNSQGVSNEWSTNSLRNPISSESSQRNTSISTPHGMGSRADFQSQRGKHSIERQQTIRDGAATIQELLRQDGHIAADWDCHVFNTTSDHLVVQYTIRMKGDANREEPTRSLIGKFFNHDRDTGPKTFRNMRAVTRILDQSQAPPILAIPDAIHYDAERHMLVQQRVPGIPYTSVVDDDKFNDYMKQAGQALAWLHAQQCVEEQPKQLEDHIQELIRPHPLELAEAYPQYRVQIHECLDYMSEMQSSWCGRIAPAPIHRDFQLRQLFYGEGRVWVVDWDLFASGDPAFDVAYFVVYLKTHLQPNQRAASIDQFLNGYSMHGSSMHLERLAVYESFNYLRRACRRFRLRDRDWEDQMRAMLEACRFCDR